MTDTETTILDILAEVLYDREPAALLLDTPLLDAGWLDSLGLMRVVTRCEERFGLTIPDDEVVPDNFETARAMAKLVDRLRPR